MHCENRQRRWDRDYLALARFWALQKSKDPSTKVGAVVVSADGLREYLGYNGFPRGIRDSQYRLERRDLKYQLIVHAEMNALLKAGNDARGGTLYTWPFGTCSNCAKFVIQAGIARVVAPFTRDKRWHREILAARAMYTEAGVDSCMPVEGEEYEREDPETKDREGAEASGGLPD